MEVKTISHCLEIIDKAVLKGVDIITCGNIWEFFIRSIKDTEGDEYKTIIKILKQITLILKILYEIKEEEMEDHYIELKKLVLLCILE